MKFSTAALVKFLSRPALMAWVLPWLMVLVVAGTVAQKYIGLFAAQKIFFGSFILWLGPVPLPGAFLTIGFILISLTVKFITASPWNRRNTGTIIAHLGALLLLAGGLLTAATARETELAIRESETVATLPFEITLHDVVEDFYPGTFMARAYHSDITVRDGTTTFPARIEMNAPLRYRGYTLFQTSYVRDDKGESTVLTAVENTGRLFPYVSSALLAAGLLIHTLISAGALKFLLRAGLILLVLAPGAARAEQPNKMPMDHFARIPILHEGRIKPMESFARTHLKIFSGVQAVDGLSANEWLAELLFSPLDGAQRRVFKIAERDTVLALRLPARPNDLYSLSEVAQAIGPADGKDSAAIESLRGRILIYTQLMRSVSLLLPLAVAVPPSLGKAPETVDYMALAKLRERADAKLKTIVARKGSDLNRYSAAEKEIAQFAWQLNLLAAGGSDNVYFRVIPPAWEGPRDQWLSPWMVVLAGQGSPATSAALTQWKNLSQSWLDGDSAKWDVTARDVGAQTVIMAKMSKADRARIETEIQYNRLQPYGWAIGLYCVGLILLYFRKDILSSISLATGIALHSVGLAARMFILMRPPVGTLYESLLFVSLVVAGLGLLLYFRGRDKTALACGALGGSGILAASLYFAAHDGDTLTVLAAVLNTNFWLATHVVFITGGYGFCVLTALLGHIWLALRRPHIATLMHRMALAALFFTATGTLLGGIWADQSWGRFWGWDPKENGALMIVLWLIWLMHGRMAGLFKPPVYAAGMAALAVVVALSWFGVNLLSVGLHSYGFISGIAAGLAAFCAAELLLIAVLYYAGGRRHAA